MASKKQQLLDNLNRAGVDAEVTAHGAGFEASGTDIDKSRVVTWGPTEEAALAALTEELGLVVPVEHESNDPIIPPED